MRSVAANEGLLLFSVSDNNCKTFLEELHSSGMWYVILQVLVQKFGLSVNSQPYSAEHPRKRRLYVTLFDWITGMDTFNKQFTLVGLKKTH